MLTNKQFIVIDQELLKTFEEWFDVLTFFNDKTENRELVTDYFFEHFAQSPEKFYEFVHFLEKKILKIRKKEAKVKASKRYLEIISFLCERFGFCEEKRELDDLCFKIINPSSYKKISRELSAYQKKSEATIQSILDILQQALRKQNHRCLIKGRYKNIYSIYKKLEKKRQRKIQNLVDIFAFRIITEKNSSEECFEILNLLHDTFYPVAHYFDDYISVPKVNGYQSLHTGLTNILPNLDIPVEIQIRTQEMDHFAEKGVAAHWIYGKTKQAAVPNEREQMISEYFSHLSKANDQEKMLYCFSYKGDVLKLKRGSTILDFASRIHTELPKRAKAALVNGSKKRVHYQIQEGDQIKLLLK
ncbi:MAG: TGS domain-containing protein [Candidatus Altimarinota bacterium]